jgi:GH25 family lysozyme M1 (1,4-beta-N-acetylmuramidase)
MNWYLVTNEFDEKPRLVQADSTDGAIAKAKATISSEELDRRRLRDKKSIEAWNDLYRASEEQDLKSRRYFAELGREYKVPPIYTNYRDPAEADEYTLDDYPWWAREFDMTGDVVVLEDLVEG